MNALPAAIAAFLVTIVAILVLRPLALQLELVDRPGGRKAHVGEVPLVGGLAMFIGLVVALGFLFPSPHVAAPLLGVFGLLVLVGLLDDRFGLSPTMRLLVHLAAGGILIGATGVMIRTMGDPFGTGIITLSTLGAVAFTLAMITGAVNSFNMLDGMDGLAGINALASLGGLGVLASMTPGADVEQRVSLVMAAAIVGFLIFNMPVRANHGLRCFMGDAGSTLLGVGIAWLCASLSQRPIWGAAPSPATVLWMVPLPLFELWWTFIRRVGRGHSPFHADAGHFHHVLRDAGLNTRAAFVAFALLDIVLVGAGLLLGKSGLPDWAILAALVATGVVTVRSMYLVKYLVPLLPKAVRLHLPPDHGAREA